MSTDSDRKKPFSSLEKDLFLNIIQKYETILSCKQTNAISAYKKKSTWESIKEEFNTSSIVTQQASTKQLVKLWYNMKAKARESKTKENVRHLTGGGPAVIDMDPVDAKVMDIDKNILTNIEVEIDSDINGAVTIVGDNNNEAWSKHGEKIVTEEVKEADQHIKATPRKMRNVGDKNYGLDYIRSQILQVELENKQILYQQEMEHKQKLGELELKIKEEEYKIKVLERIYKEKIQNIDLEIKNKLLKAMEK